MSEYRARVRDYLLKDQIEARKEAEAEVERLRGIHERLADHDTIRAHKCRGSIHPGPGGWCSAERHIPADDLSINDLIRLAGAALDEGSE